MKTNTIYCGDCKNVLVNHIPDGSVDLIYVDPPFFSNKQYEIIWGDGYELRCFEDRWKGGIENYIIWMEDKVRECHRVLKPTGSMYLHCDYHANAHLRILMDKIFDENHFQNEIIWCRSAGFKRSSAKKFPTKNDIIFFYTKSKEHYFEPQYKPHKPEYLERFKPDKTGRLCRTDVNPTKGGRRTIYLDEVKGDLIDSVWDDINPVNPMAKERLGYPTQKPKALLERIIKASSKTTDIVLDPMCGCGTAIAAAHKLGRRWIGIDVSPSACKLMVKRMRKLGVSISEKNIIGLPQTFDEIKSMQPFEFQNWVCQKLLARVSQRKSGDMGIDGWTIDGRPLQVKQSEHVGRNVVDNFETAIRRMKKTKGIIVAISFGKGAYEEIARVKNKEGLEIELKTVEEILREA